MTTVTTAKSATKARPRILLAEDELAMRTFLADVLRVDGYDVVEAANGRELFWTVEAARRGKQIDLVISDLRMPTYNGLDVAEAWTDVGGAPRMLLMSAFPDGDVRARAAALGLVLLEKPFVIGRFRRVVRDLLQPPKAKQ